MVALELERAEPPHASARESGISLLRPTPERSSFHPVTSWLSDRYADYSAMP